MGLRRVRPVDGATLATLSTERLHAYRRQLLDLPDALDPEDVTDRELEEAKDPAFLFFREDPAWAEQVRVLMEIIRAR